MTGEKLTEVAPEAQTDSAEMDNGKLIMDNEERENSERVRGSCSSGSNTGTSNERRPEP